MDKFRSFYEMLEYWAERTPEAAALIYANADESGTCEMSFAELYSAVTLRARDFSAQPCYYALCTGSREDIIDIFAAAKAGSRIVMLDASLDEPVLEKLKAITRTDTADGTMLFFTSGTTSMSKAVVLTESSMCASAWNGSEMLPLTPDDTLMCMLPLGHVFGFVCGLLWGLSNGASVALGRGVRHYTDDLSFFKPTAVSVVPSLLKLFDRINAFNPELRIVLTGAGDCSPDLMESVKAKLPDAIFAFGYGLTETSSGVAISVGTGDPYALSICPDDTITIAKDGEILIESPTCMMKGYYNDPEGTAEVLRDGVLYTGDLGLFDPAGKLHITGRKKEMLVLPDGMKIFLPEYEARLSELLGTAELAVTLKGNRPVLIIQTAMTDAQIFDTIRPFTDELPRSQQLSEIILTDEPLPRTATGKVQRWQLREFV